MLQSFSDAPGGLREELREITLSSGLEYSYKVRLSLHAGYFYESKFKGEQEIRNGWSRDQRSKIPLRLHLSHYGTEQGQPAGEHNDVFGKLESVTLSRSKGYIPAR